MSNQFCKQDTKGYIDWPLDLDLAVTFELPTKRVMPFLPDRLRPVEPRPGISLLFVDLSGFSSNALGCLPRFYEPNICVIIHSDLTKKDPSGANRMPGLSLFTLNLTSDSDGFLRHAYLIDKMPVYLSKELQVKVKNNLNVSVSDLDGPVFDLEIKKPDLDNPYKHTEFFIQVYSTWERILYYSPVYFYGKMFEHQKREYAGKLYQHPFFRGLEVAGIGAHDVFMQQATAPKEAKLRFYTPQPVRPLKPHEWDPTSENKEVIAFFLEKTKGLYAG